MFIKKDTKCNIKKIHKITEKKQNTGSQSLVLNNLDILFGFVKKKKVNKGLWLLNLL